VWDQDDTLVELDVCYDGVFDREIGDSDERECDRDTIERG